LIPAEGTSDNPETYSSDEDKPLSLLNTDPSPFTAGDSLPASSARVPSLPACSASSVRAPCSACPLTSGEVTASCSSDDMPSKAIRGNRRGRARGRGRGTQRSKAIKQVILLYCAQLLCLRLTPHCRRLALGVLGAHAHSRLVTRSRRPRRPRRAPAFSASTERTWLRATAVRVQQHVPGPPEARYHRAEVGRGMLMDGVALEQAPRVPTTEKDAARSDAGQGEQSGGLALLPAQDGARPHRAVPQEDRQARQ